MAPPKIPAQIPATISLILALVAWACGLPLVVYNPALILSVLLLALACLRATAASVAANCGLLLAGTLGALLVGDVALRLSGIFDRVPQDHLLRRDPVYPFLSRYRPGGCFEGRRPGTLRAILGGVPQDGGYPQVFEVDERGFRNPLGASAREVDLLILGDSFAEGGVASQQEMWPEKLRGLTRRSVYCSAISGSSPWTQLMIAKLWTHELDLAPFAVVIWMLFGGNDLGEFYGEGIDPPPPLGLAGRFKTRWETVRRRSPLRRIWSAIDDRPSPEALASLVPEILLPDGTRTYFFSPHLEMVRRGPAEVHAMPNFPKFQEVFREMVRYLRSRNLRVVVVRAPSKEEVYRGMLPQEDEASPGLGFHQVVSELSQEAAASYLDLGPALREAGRRLLDEEGRLLYFHDDTHWNEAGNAVVAEVIASYLHEDPPGESPRPAP